MRFGYNTNGFAHHRLPDALMVLAQLGYESVAITIDHDFLDPHALDLGKRLSRVKSLLQRFNLRCVVETGARFILDPFHKHQPTLISPKAEQRQQRIEFLASAISIARELESDIVSFWSGTASDDAPPAELMQRLVEGCRELCGKADSNGVRLAFEPEPGMFIDRMAGYEELSKQVNHHRFGLTLDIGHLHCQGETPIADQIRRYKDRLWNIHIEDMRHGVHEHLMFSEGEIDFPPVLAALRDIGYEGGLHVELSRHSHDAVNTARRAMEFLKRASV
jgi:L-ribulose-5-phosphate 3-epimerase